METLLSPSSPFPLLSPFEEPWSIETLETSPVDRLYLDLNSTMQMDSNMNFDDDSFLNQTKSKVEKKCLQRKP